MSLIKFDRKEIIIKEINFWKKSRILPEKYCDYLLALYTKGNESTIEQRKRSMTVIQVLNSSFLILLLPLCTLFIKYNFTPLFVELIVLLLILIYSFLTMFKNKEYNIVTFSIALYVSMLNLLVISIYYVNLFLPMTIFSLIIISIQFLAWLFYGLKIKRSDVKIMSVFGFLFSIVYIFL